MCVYCVSFVDCANVRLNFLPQSQCRCAALLCFLWSLVLTVPKRGSYCSGAAPWVVRACCMY